MMLMMVCCSQYQEEFQYCSTFEEHNTMMLTLEHLTNDVDVYEVRYLLRLIFPSLTVIGRHAIAKVTWCWWFQRPRLPWSLMPQWQQLNLGS
jgi:hypothetical protein